MAGSLLLALALCAGPVTMRFEGTLDEAIHELAKLGGMNVVAVGSFTERAQVDLADATAEEALDTLALAYGLDVTKQGKVWVLKRPPGATGDRVSEAAPGGATAPAPSAAPVPARDGRAAGAEALPEDASAPPRPVGGTSAAGRPLVGMGEPVRVVKGQRVETAVAYGAPVVVEAGAEVTGDAVSLGGDVVIERGGVVGGDAVSVGGAVRKAEGARVGGDTVSVGVTALGAAIAKGAPHPRSAASGDVEEDGKEEDASPGRSWVAGFLSRFALFFGLGFLLMMFAPERLRRLEACIREQPAASGLVGFLSLLSLVPLTVLLLVTLIGIPVAMVLWVAFAVAVPLGLAAAGNALGAALPSGSLRRTRALTLGLGLLALLLAAEVPVLGPIVLGLAVLVSLGAIVRTRFGRPTSGPGAPVGGAVVA